MEKKLTTGDILGLGLLIFSFFLGAGNLIFPPVIGKLAGWHVGWAFSGFILSSVLLPLIALIAVAKRGSFRAMMTDLPKGLPLLSMLLIFSLIGPLLITPRTGLVAYEMAIKPWVSESYSQAQGWSTAVFFLFTGLGCWSRGGLLDCIGKVVTPVFLALLLVLAIGLFWVPVVELSTPQGNYGNHPLTQGLLGGYQTMDTFGSLMFGTLIIQILRDKGITKAEWHYRYLIGAGLIAATGLIVVYSSLFWLGATSKVAAEQVQGGGQLLAAYVQALFGHWGQGLLGIVMLLACLTTAIDLLSGFSDYMANLTSWPYRFWLLLSSVISTVVANLELTTLITISQPIMLALYPPTILVTFLAFIRHKLVYPRLSYRLLLSVALLGGIVDALNGLGIDVSGLSFIPGFHQGLAWCLPSLGLTLLLYYLPQQRTTPQEASVISE
ncbi:MAG: branched-chain amino acid transport system II carrier protein [Candidatus Symbiodolus clandestinus]